MLKGGGGTSYTVFLFLNKACVVILIEKTRILTNYQGHVVKNIITCTLYYIKWNC